MIVEGPLLTGLQGLLGVVMAAEGAIKLVGHESQVEGFERFGYPQWFRLVTGGLELLGAAGLVVGLLAGPAVGLASGLVVAVVLVGAVATHVRVGDSVAMTAPAVVLLILTALLLVTHLQALP